VKQYWFPFGLTVAIAVAAYLTGATQTLGAHPFWAEKVIILGAPMGIALGYIATRIRYGLAVAGLAGLTIAALAVAHLGKTRFAASYDAEDALAGQMWFLGWHVVVVFALATLFVAAAGLKKA